MGFVDFLLSGASIAGIVWYMKKTNKMEAAKKKAELEKQKVESVKKPEPKTPIEIAVEENMSVWYNEKKIDDAHEAMIQMISNAKNETEVEKAAFAAHGKVVTGSVQASDLIEFFKQLAAKGESNWNSQFITSVYEHAFNYLLEGNVFDMKTDKPMAPEILQQMANNVKLLEKMCNSRLISSANINYFVSRLFAHINKCPKTKKDNVILVLRDLFYPVESFLDKAKRQEISISGIFGKE